MRSSVQRGRLAALVLLLLTPGDQAGLYYAAVSSGARRSAAPVAMVRGSRLPAVHGAVIGLASGGAVAAYDAMQDGRRAIGVSVLTPRGRVRAAAVPGGAGGVYPQLALATDDTVLLAYTGKDADGPTLHLALVALPEADH